MLKKRHEEIFAQAAKHEKNVLGSQEYQQELSFLNRTVQDFIKSVRLCELAATRWEEFGECYLLPAYLDDIIEAALAAQLSIENGMLNPARRELRFMLEVAVNIAYVDELRAKDSFADRTAFYRGKGVNKANVDHVSELPLRMLPDNRESFIASTRSAWVKGSNYVHLTKRRVDEKMALRESGIRLGFETTEMIERISADVHEACSLVMVLVFETIGPLITGDMLVGGLDQEDDWALHASGYIAAIDSFFDYKAERRAALASHTERRTARVRFPIST